MSRDKPKILFTIVIVLLFVFLGACGPEVKIFTIDIKIHPTGKVYYKFIFSDIGHKESQDPDKEFEYLRKEFIEGSSLEDSFKEKSPEFQLKKKKFWVRKGSLNAEFLFEVPTLESFLNSVNEIGAIKQDQQGNYFCSIDIKETVTLQSNGKIETLDPKIKRITWPAQADHMYYSITMHPDYKITSLSKRFRQHFGRSKTTTH